MGKNSLEVCFIQLLIFNLLVCQAKLFTVSNENIVVNSHIFTSEKFGTPNYVSQENSLNLSMLVDCAPEGKTNSVQCESRGCIYRPVQDDTQGIPWCYFPANHGYSLVSSANLTTNKSMNLTHLDLCGDRLIKDTVSIVEHSRGFEIKLRKNKLSGSLFGDDILELKMTMEFQTDERLRIKITNHDENAKRFEVPILIPYVGSDPKTRLYDIEFKQGCRFSFKIIRRSTKTVLFNTDLPGFVFSNQFIQLAALLPSSYVYGLGENEQTHFRHDMSKWKTWYGWARDQPPDGSANSYGVHPMYTVAEKPGVENHFHSVLFLNSNAQEWTLTPQPGFVYKTIGGILDIYFFLGPAFKDVTSQYTQAIGRYPLPPYWSLGFHLCRYGYQNLTNMRSVVKRMRSLSIPLDAQWGDIDIMDESRDFTIDKKAFAGMKEFVDRLKQTGIKFVTILDPAISTGNNSYEPFITGNKMNVWLKRSDGSNLVGKVWPKDDVYFPDFTNSNTTVWWKDLITKFHSKLLWDGLWIDMNEPSNFINGDQKGCKKNKLNDPPYKTGARGDSLSDKTVCPDAQQVLGRHYDTHNLYGWSQTLPTMSAVRKATGTRGFLLSRSTFVGSGRWTAHWLGDNFSRWSNMRASIIGMLQFNMFGIPHVGADIGGFNEASNPEMLIRWHQLGAFYPFSRNHNSLGMPDQDPGAFGSKVANKIRRTLNYRYTLLPYLYTLFYLHATQGTTVCRPLWAEFPLELETLEIDQQFMWGSGLLISPVVYLNERSKNVYFPRARWYDISRYLEDPSLTYEAGGGWRNVTVPLDMILLHVRGGNIITLQRSGLNTALSRKNSFSLLVGLDDQFVASGILFFDDGETVDTIKTKAYYRAEFTCSKDGITGRVQNDGYHDMKQLYIEIIDIMGLKNSNISDVRVDGRIHNMFTMNGNGHLHLYDLTIKMTMEAEKWTIIWM